MPLFKKRDRSGKPAKVDRRDAWRAAAERIGGRLEEGRKASKDRIVLEHGAWELVLDTYTVHTGQVVITYTRGRAFFTGQSALKVLFRPRNTLDRLLGAFGWGSSAPVNRIFDRKWLVRGKPTSRLRGIASPALTDLLMSGPSLRLKVGRAPRKQRKEFGPDTREVTTHVTGVTKDVDRIAHFFAVLRESLDAMERAGVAVRQPVRPWTPPTAAPRSSR